MTTPLGSTRPASSASPELERLLPDRPSQLPTERTPDGGRPSLIDASVWDQGEAVRAAVNNELHSDLLREAVPRLAKIAGFTAGAVALYLSYLLLLRSHAEFGRLFPIAARSLVGAFALSVAMYGVTRVQRLRPKIVIDLGYGYLFFLTLLLGILRHAQVSPPTELLRQVSPVVLPILAFGALIPTTPKNALVVSVAAALMDPLALFMMRQQHNYTAAELTLLLASPLLSALVAHQISRLVYRLNEGIAKAREVGSYSLVERLGSGGMAEVWRAQHQMLARPAAVKLIRTAVLERLNSIDSARILRLFAREARTTAGLRSPHTILLYDFGITREGSFYYVMELLEGVDLQTLVERFGRQSSERVSQLLAQACHSLIEAHERNFVHRDIKPGNIFICAMGGEFDFVKVLDFGLVLDRHPTAEELEDDQRFVGTPSVMAPEMVRFQAPVDARADLYALGCVAYFLLTGVRVFEASTRHDMLVMHAHQRPLPPSKRAGVALHEGLEALVMCCLEKNPNRRPQTARELLERLSALEFEHTWTQERARLWWHKQLPGVGIPAKAEEVREDAQP